MINELESLGLTEGEAKAYVALLEIGVSTVGPIAKKSGISYSKIYEVLQRLLEKGLVSFIVKEKTRYYRSVAPNRLKDYLEKQKEEVVKKEKKLKKLMPELKKITMNVKKQEAEIFLGMKGLKSAYENFLEGIPKNEIIYFFYEYVKEHRLMIDKFYANAFPMMEKTGHKWKGLSIKEYEYSHFVEKYPSFIEFKIVDYPIPGNIDISKEKVLQIAWSKVPVAILIHSREIAGTFRKFFERVWG
jgi:predicted transcriptional regulator